MPLECKSTTLGALGDFMRPAILKLRSWLYHTTISSTCLFSLFLCFFITFFFPSTFGTAPRATHLYNDHDRRIQGNSLLLTILSTFCTSD
jgi:hypothetical protein